VRLTRTHFCLPSRWKSVAQKQVTPATFDADECSPEWVLWRKTLTHDESGSLDMFVTPGNLWGECQEQFIQAWFGKEVTHQLRSPLDQHHVTLTGKAHRLQDSPRADRTSALDCRELHRWWQTLCANALCALRGRDEQHRYLTGPKHRQVQADLPARGHDDVERRC